MFIKEYDLKINNADEILKKLDLIASSLKEVNVLISELNRMEIDFCISPKDELQEDFSNEVEQG